MSRISTSEILFKIIQLLCVAFCVAQLVDVVIKYFSFETRTSVQLVIRDRDTMPAITLAAVLQPAIDFYNYKIRKLPKNTTKEVDIKNLIHLVHMYILDECTVDLQGNGQQEHCNRISNVTMRTDGKRVFATYFERDLTMGTEDKFTFNLKSLNSLFIIKLRSFPIPICVYLTAPDVFSGLSDRCDSYIFFGHQLLIDFKKTIIHRLPYPYTSDCYDYDNSGLHSSFYCLDSCLIKYSMKKCGTDPYEVSQVVDENFKYNIAKDNKCVDRWNLTEKCLHLCDKLDCRNENYELMMKKIDSVKKIKRKKLIFKRPSQSFYIDYKETPLLMGLEATVYIGGTIGIWFGLSVLITLKFAVKSLKIVEIFTPLFSFISKVLCLQTLCRKLKRGNQATKRSILSQHKMQIIVLICLIGCVAQNVEIMRTYLEKHITIELHNKYFDFEDFPAISFFDKSTKIGAKEDICFSSYCVNRKSIRNITKFRQLLLSKLFIQCIFLNVRRHIINCGKFSHFTVYKFNNISVYTIFKRKGKQLSSELYKIKRWPTYFMQINLNPYFIDFNKTEFIIHSPTTLPTEAEIRMGLLPLKIKDTIYRYSRIKYFKLLPRPYFTNCNQNYKQISKSECIVHCLSIMTKLICKTLPKDSYIDLQTLVTFDLSDKQCANDTMIYETCARECKDNDCEITEYSVKEMWERNDIGSIYLDGIALTTTSSYILKPKNSFLDVVVYIEGSICIWFGLPIIYFTRIIDILMRKVFNNIPYTNALRKNNISIFYRRSKRNTKRNFTLCYKFIIVLVCLIGCGAQVADVLLTFTRRATTMDITVDTRETHRLPALSLLVAPKFVISLQALKRIKRIPKTISKRETQILSTNRTVIKDCWIKAQSNKKIKCKPFISASSEPNYILLTILRHKYNNIEFNTGNKYEVAGKLTITKLPNIPELSGTLAFHPFHSLISVIGTPHIDYRYKQKTVVSVSFSKLTVKLLPFPFKTNCRDYNEIGMNSHEECLENCKVSFLRDKCNAFPSFSLYTESDIIRKALTNNIRTIIVCNRKHKIKQICNARCQKQDCQKEYYTITEVGSKEDENIGNDSVIQIMTPPTNQFSQLKLRPRFKAYEAIIYVGNSIALWFGLSINLTITFLYKKRKDLLDLFVNVCDKVITRIKYKLKTIRIYIVRLKLRRIRHIKRKRAKRRLNY